MRIGWWLIVMLVAGVWCAPAARAQSIDLDVDAMPLDQALALLSTQAGIDVVFAQRLVQNRTVTCRYAGDDTRAALACLLAATGLDVQPIRRRQYVLIDAAAPELGLSGPAPRPHRGLLAGFVADAGTDDALPGAHVYLPTLRLGTVTNEAGYFALPDLPLGTHRVRVSYLGYAVLDTLLAVDAALSLRMRPTTVAAGGVVVEGSEQTDAGAVPGVVALPVGQLEQLPSALGESDLFQALQWVPGVRKSGEISGGLIVRGGEADQNLYLLDGAPVYHPWHAFSLISTFQTETFKDIRLYRGAFPAEHGGRLSAVLDAELRDGNRDEPRAMAGLSVFSGRFLIESPITANSSFMLSGRGSYLEKLVGKHHPVESDDGRRDTLRTGYHFYDWSAKLSVRPGPNSRLSASYYLGRDVLDLRLPFDLSLDFQSWLRPADLFFEVDQHWGNRLFSLRYQHLFTRRFFFTATGYASSYRAREAAFIQPTSTASVVTDYGVRLHDVGLKLDVDYYPTLAHRMRAGVHVVQRRFRSELEAVVARAAGVSDTILNDSRVQAAEVAVYVQDAWQPTPRWLVEPGLRLSFFSGGRHTRLSPRLSARYTPREAVVVRGSLSSQVQYLHRLRDRNAFLYDLVSSRWIPVDEGVRPGRSMQASVGAEARPRPWLSLAGDVYARYSRHVLLPKDPFQTKDGLVGPGIETGTLLGAYAAGEARAYGLELEARLERGRYHAWLSYAGGRSLNRSRSLGEGHYRPARFDVPRAFRAVVGRRTRHWDVSLSGLLRSGYPLTVPTARYELGGPLDEPEAYLYRPAINNGRLPPTLRLDLTAGYRFRLLGGAWRAQLHVYNLTARRNVVDRTYDPAPPIVTASDRYGAPLLPLLELEVAL